MELKQLEEVWNSKEMYARSSSEAQFHSWFTKYQAQNMKEKMLKPLRQAAGLGQIPAEYTNNPNESTNARIKEKVDYELNTFCQKMKELVESQTQHIESAFTLDAGPYAVSDTYLRYKENPQKWVKQTRAYRQRVINQIHKIDLLPQPSASIHPSQVIDLDTFNAAGCSSSIQCGEADVPVTADDMKENALPLSVTWKEVGLSEEIYKGMWEKAACLVADEKAIMDAPGLSDAKMVASLTCPQKPHLVCIMANGKMTCDCLNYKTKFLCSHVLAVAE